MTSGARVGYRLLGIGLAVGLWELLGRLLGTALLAPFSETARRSFAMLADGVTLSTLATTLLRMLVGFGAGCLVGMPLGIAMGRLRLVDRLAHPWVTVLATTSTAALVPLFLVLLGRGFAFQTAVTFTACVCYVALTAQQGARHLDRRLLDVGRSFAAGRWRTYRTIHVPALFPYLMAGARVGLIHALRAMVMAELYVVMGFGGLLHRTSLETSTAPLLADLLLLAIVSLAATWALRTAGRILAPWYHERQAAVGS